MLFSFGSLSSVIECQENPEKVILNNISGSENIFSLSVKNRVKIVVYAETSALYEASKKYQ